MCRATQGEPRRRYTPHREVLFQSAGLGSEGYCTCASMHTPVNRAPCVAYENVHLLLSIYLPAVKSPLF